MSASNTIPAPTRYRRFTPARVTAFLVIVLALVIWQGNQKIPTGAAAGNSLNGPVPASRPTGPIIRVATFNIDGGVGLADDRLDLDRTANAMRGFDLIGLQEVHHAEVFSDISQAQILGQKLNLPWLFAPVERQWWHDAFGNAVLTSLPVSHWQRFPLANENSDSNRNVLLLRVEYFDRPLNVLITHLDRQNDHKAELASVISMFLSLQEPAILMGDLNTPKSDAQLQTLRDTAGISDPIGQALNDKRTDSVDWIFARGLRATAAGFIDNGASDHPLAWAEFEIAPNPHAFAAALWSLAPA